MLADGGEGLLAQVVLDLAGVPPGGVRADAQAHEELSEELVALVHALRDLESRRQQHDHARRVQGDIAAFPQALGGVADAGSILLDPIKATIVDRAMPIQGSAVQVVPAQLANTAGVIGASLLINS